MTLYKLTDQDGYTRRGAINETRWAAGVTHRAQAEGSALCTEQVIHAYEHPLVALLLSPLHADFASPRLWEATGDVIAREGQQKCGVKTLTVLRELPLPEVTTEHRVRFAILCAKTIYREAAFVAWADAWLSGVDRSPAAAWAAKAAAKAAAWAAAWAARGATFDLNALAEQAVQE